MTTFLVCAECRQGFTEGEQRIPITRRNDMAATFGNRLPEVLRPEVEAVHPDCFDPAKHEYAG